MKYDNKVERKPLTFCEFIGGAGGAVGGFYIGRYVGNRITSNMIEARHYSFPGFNVGGIEAELIRSTAFLGAYYAVWGLSLYVCIKYGAMIGAYLIEELFDYRSGGF